MAKILVVEDYESLQKIYNTVLSLHGHDVDLANDGLQAVESINRTEYDLILLDILLPGIDGLEFLRTTDLAHKHPHTKVVVLSNLADPDIIKETHRLGVAEYLNKPGYTPKEVSEIITRVLKEPAEPEK